MLASQCSQKDGGVLGGSRADATHLREQGGSGAAPSIRGVRGPLAVPTEIEVDATAALAGPMRDRVSRASRYLAARLAMVRQSIQDGQIAPIKVPGVGHRADGFTKPLVGEAFRTFAAANLGLGVDNLVAPGRVRAPPGASHNGGYGGDFASRSGDTGGGTHGPGGHTALPNGATAAQGPPAETARATAAKAQQRPPRGRGPGTRRGRRDAGRGARGAKRQSGAAAAATGCNCTPMDVPSNGTTRP